MPEGPNLAETPRCGKIRKCTETIIYLLLMFILYPISLNNEEIIFRKYLQDFNKSYENETVYQQRFEAFKESLKHIENLNSYRSNGSAIYGLTKYSDMTPQEFSKSQLIMNSHNETKNVKLKVPKMKRSLTKFRFKIPPKVDFREKNLVTEITTQGPCGACWAFSVIGIIETMNALKTGYLSRLSVQQMIDCSLNDYGCLGGDVCSLLDWITTFHIKITTEDNYPLSLTTGKCKKNIKPESGDVQVDKYECSSFVNEEDFLLYYLAKFGPLAVGINAQTWQHYIGGIIQYHCDSSSEKLNHAVQIIGYDLTAPIPHYIIRNSWGTDFGDDGYMYVAIGDNLCGLTHEVASVKIL